MISRRLEADWRRLQADGGGLIAEPIAPGVTRLSERVLAAESRSYFYLVEGEERDCLIDGGWGFCRSLDEIGATPGKPLVAVATHSHFDHIGALHMAGERLGHIAEKPVFRNPDPLATQALPFLVGLSVLHDGSSISPHSIRQEPCPLDGCLGDGDILDLGGRTLRFLHTPGHSPGSLSALDETHGLLFCADTLHDGYIYDDIPGADQAALAASHLRLSRLSFGKACPGHGQVLDRRAFMTAVERYRRQVGS